jgi:hypothetical protein
MRTHHKETERQIIPIAQRPGITKVLSKNGMKPEDLREQFHFLLDIGLGVIDREVISNDRQLNRLLSLRQRKFTAGENSLTADALAMIGLSLRPYMSHWATRWRVSYWVVLEFVCR